MAILSRGAEKTVSRIRSLCMGAENKNHHTCITLPETAENSLVPTGANRAIRGQHPNPMDTKEKKMANNETEFRSKFKKLCKNRAVIITVVTLLAATCIIIAVTVSANRAKRPTNDGNTTVTDTAADTSKDNPTIKDETLPVYNGGETQPVDADPDEALFDLPVSGKLTGKHDPTIQVYNNTMGDYRVHLGVDIATAANAPVYAAADGKVEKVWNDAMMGSCVAVAHGNETVSIYKNLSKTLADGIAVGAEVKQGQKLGTVGDTAVVEMADEPHLHFEMTVKGLSVDPLDYFSESAVATLSNDSAYEETATAGTTAVTEPNGKK